MATLGSHAGSALPGMESTPVQRTTDSPSVGEHDADLGSSAAQQRPTLLTEDEDLVPDNALCLKRQRALKRRMGPRRDANKIVKTYRDLQRKVLPKAYAEDPSPYDPAHIFCVLYQ
jgi:hypothetical protein